MLELAPGIIAVVVLSLPLWFAVSVGNDPVKKRRVERFAARHALEVTVQNGQQIIRYLATTRRWRAFGLAAGLVLSIAWFLPNFTVNSLYLFAGWFAGALIAELRISHLPHGATRAALVAPRLSRSYLSWAARLLVPLATVVCLLVGALTGALLWTLGGVAVGIAVWLTQRHVLRRPQPAAEPHQLAADDAIRSRSLHVLAGGGAALIGYCVLGQIGGNLFGALLIPLLGYLVANQSWRVARVH